MRLRYLWWLVLIVLGVSVLAQPGLCSPIVEEALAVLDENCSALERNNACYGYNRVDASFTVDVEDDYFQQPEDITGINILTSLQTSGLNESDSEWGVALMRLQTSLPDTLPGQAVTFLLLGDVSMETAVDASSFPDPVDPISVQTTVNVALRNQPEASSKQVTLIPYGTDVLADALSEDGRWLRVAYGDLPGWILRSYTDSDGIELDLPNLTPEVRTPMQAFYLKTGPMGTSCAGTPQDSLMIQSPEGIEVDFNVNGADIRVGSTILIRTPSPGVMEIVVVEGSVFILPTPENPQGIRLYAGQRSQVCVSDGDNPTTSCAWSPPQDILVSELLASFCGTEEIGVLTGDEGLPCDPGEYPTGGDVQPPAPSPESTPETVISVETFVDENGLLDNLCFPGGAWDDGRCDDPDPSVRNWHWNAGWYLVRLEDGRLEKDDIPAPYRPGEPEATGNLSGTWSCSGFDQFTVSYSVPSGTTSVSLTWQEVGEGTINRSASLSGGGGSSIQSLSDPFANVQNGRIVAQPSGMSFNLSGTLYCGGQ